MIELIIALLFFSVSGAVILRMFAAADMRSLKNAVKEKAVLCVQSVSELYTLNGDMRKSAETLFGSGSLSYPQESLCEVFLDENASPANVPYSAGDQLPPGTKLKLEMRETHEKETGYGSYSRLDITMYYLDGNAGDEVYKGSCYAYIPYFGGDEPV